MHLKKAILLILGIAIIAVIIIFSQRKTDYQIDDKVNTVTLTVYGLKAEPSVYSLNNKDNIELLIKKINNITVKENKIMDEQQLDKPKGVSYKLDFIGNKNYEYMLIHGYCISNEEVYRVDNYNTFVEDIVKIFE